MAYFLIFVIGALMLGVGFNSVWIGLGAFVMVVGMGSFVKDMLLSATTIIVNEINNKA